MEWDSTVLEWQWKATIFTQKAALFSGMQNVILFFTVVAKVWKMLNIAFKKDTWKNEEFIDLSILLLLPCLWYMTVWQTAFHRMHVLWYAFWISDGSSHIKLGQEFRRFITPWMIQYSPQGSGREGTFVESLWPGAPPHRGTGHWAPRMKKGGRKGTGRCQRKGLQIQQKCVGAWEPSWAPLWLGPEAACRP